MSLKLAQDPLSNFAIRPQDCPMPSFMLFRATGPTPSGVTHTGTVRCPHCERIAFVEARVTEPTDEVPTKHFEGETYPIDLVGREKKPTQPLPPKTPQRSLELEQLPFNDPLPPVGTTPARTAFDRASPDPMPPALALGAQR